jgi:endonuclease-3
MPSDVRAERCREIDARLEQEYPGATCALTHADPLQLLIATILSAQCTDERVNQVTPALFRRFPHAEEYLAVPQETLEGEIRSTGFFRNKAKSIRGACQRIVEVYGGEVPRTMDALLTLPGVARKTANVVLGTAFGIAEGIAVDTHVRRLSRRLGLTQHDDPEKIERDLIAMLPRDRWTGFSHRLILHGRQVCHARKPACERCTLNDLCPTYLSSTGSPPDETG